MQDEINIDAGLTDSIAVIQAQRGNRAALDILLARYEKTVRVRARSYFLTGGDNEDIVQEGMIGLYKAVRDFKEDKQVTFKSFAEICITRQIITAIKAATRQKHMPLNSYISLNKPAFEEDSDRGLLDMYKIDEGSNPEALFIGQEDFNIVQAAIGEVLSPLEREVLFHYLKGNSYQDIALNLDRNVKSVDNAMQRIKRKLGHYLSSVKET